MTIDLEAIKAAALAATPGEWLVSGCGKSVGTPGPHGVGVAFCYRTHVRSDGEEKANAQYIATMDPQTTLALVARVEELEAAVRDAEVAAEEYAATRERVEELEAQAHRAMRSGDALLGVISPAPAHGIDLNDSDVREARELLTETEAQQ